MHWRFSFQVAVAMETSVQSMMSLHMSTIWLIYMQTRAARHLATAMFVHLSVNQLILHENRCFHSRPTCVRSVHLGGKAQETGQLNMNRQPKRAAITGPHIWSSYTEEDIWWKWGLALLKLFILSAGHLDLWPPVEIKHNKDPKEIYWKEHFQSFCHVFSHSHDWSQWNKFAFYFKSRFKGVLQMSLTAGQRNTASGSACSHERVRQYDQTTGGSSAWLSPYRWAKPLQWQNMKLKSRKPHVQ